uniref:Retrovirus-related Pol polyprotein from transposon TNT 1-94 n=1 Tax=Tanacetum cinerariifolium TaxID=118510 RepID=A0A6L2MLA6_TANCI|nr:hypothetical protein [Tanacetum cinerariifolium]
MNLQETQQVVARDEKWVPSTERVKISSTNAFTIIAEVLEILMQQFWYTNKKVKDLKSYKFLLANKKFIVDAEVFRKILDICPRARGEEFTEIDHRKQRKSRRETMPFPRFTKVIINYFFSQHKSLSNLKFQHYHTIKDDGIVSRLKFVRIGEDYHEYELPIPDMMLNDAIKRSESYQIFLKYSTGQIPPKKSRGKGSQGKKTAYTLVADVGVSKESDFEPAKKRTTSRRVVKKKVTISAADNRIPNLDVALELGESICLTEVVEEEAARQVHTTHAKIVIESEPKPAKKKIGSRITRGVVIQYTPSAPKPKPATSKLKLKGVKSLTSEEQKAVDIMQALKESKKTNRRQPGTKGSNEGTGASPGVPDESTVVSTTSKEDQGDDEEINWIDSDEDEKKKDDTDDDKSIDLEMTDDEETNDEFVHCVKQVNDDEDEEMTNAKVERIWESTVKDTTDAEINSLLDIKIQSQVPHIQSPSVLRVPVSVISEPSVLIQVQETPLVSPVTTLPPSSVSTIPPVPHQTQSGSENRSPMLSKDNYVLWSSRLLRYAKSRPNGKLIYNSIINGLYVRRMIPGPHDPNCEVPVPETFHEQTNDELTEAEIK